MRARKASKPGGANLFVQALADHEGTLPVIAAVEHDEEPPGIEASLRFLCVAGFAREAKPQHIHGSAKIFRPQPASFAQPRASPVSRHDETGRQCHQIFTRRLGDKADHAAKIV